MLDLIAALSIFNLLALGLVVFVFLRLQRSQRERAITRQEQLEQQLMLQMNHTQQQAKQSQRKQQQLIDTLYDKLAEYEKHQQTLAQETATLTNKVGDLELQDPEVKLYQQARRLIASGADIDDVIEACGIPRAELELLMAVDKEHK
ncbi:DUF2802 domain-containing protein [Alteromonas flava]|uniref:DUF2802 domain-containing protein n=1 Tax=Alteromonas flava TaxID=2048003 RepID=UPI000C28CD02|nr:DUF2802 domain-containing protein [Alteromonas flava]